MLVTSHRAVLPPNVVREHAVVQGRAQQSGMKGAHVHAVNKIVAAHK